MKDINLKGITVETITGILLLIISLTNAILQIFDIQILPITDEEISNIVSTIFLIITTLYNVYKNRNLSTASQSGQKIVDAIKAGELLTEDVENLLAKVYKEEKGRSQNEWKK